MNAIVGGRQAMIRAAASILDQMRQDEIDRAGLAARGAERLRARQAALSGPAPAVATWTPERVGDALVAALRWAHRAGGRVGPGGMVGARLPEAILSMEDRLELGWGLHELADPDDAPPMQVQLSAAQVSRHEAALEWPARYLCPDHAGSARIVGLWAACKARRISFDAAIKRRGTIARATAYRMRDKGLSLISQGLDRDGVPLPA